MGKRRKYRIQGERSRRDSNASVDETIRVAEQGDGELEREERGWQAFLSGLKKKRRRKDGHHV